ncbi:flagellar hook protein FlgE [Bradyrhizobium sp. 44]|jgi:flagellar hook protein FlgE|uniref:flagellar hook protein FlgE n=1 Tax=unclassified Bradyrhizobium TaxID=2631580 RepID=UPI0004813492|nr:MULTISPECIES: flagellar hook protein FlgE [unclassified Bradyrhizobium]MCK1284602.1 flagellar hook protein FlgE [Bradyrhizobium sp. 44]MCK1301522.1 flagellar hook protein FlgE [Bradyrhizobium sp. 37]MCK1363659.1 flagellar hook protein FlgE [Bradyrhizobium sp. 62]MCK1399403.1 flagellar hook protein FlgE [Bradyrhizobium sp. 39]MCK1407209.1 flagellar hook protein FlgE [Bradyrhizobium sp. 76]
MSLYGIMRTGVSGMAAQSNKLSTVSDNIANVNTTGYKRASTEFSSLILKSGSGNYDSGAVETTVRYAISDAGHTQFTTSSTDLAVQGNGFFVVSDATNTQQFLTRAGSFVPDSQGNLVNAAGYYLLGQPGKVTNFSQNSLSGMQIVNIAQVSQVPVPSTAGTLTTGNLDPTAALIAGPPGPGAYSSKSSIVAYDNIGQPVKVDLYMSHTATAAGLDTWQIQAYNSTTGATLGATGTYTFDTTTAGKGALAAASATTLAFPVTGGATVTLDLSNMTQVGTNFSFKATVNGSVPSAIDKVDVDQNGYVTAVLKNGQQLTLYTLMLADVASPDNLTPEPGNVYSTNQNSGNAQAANAGTGGLGTIQSEALEDSNVDLADELTGMIEAQRGFTANSKSFQTGADLLDVVVNLKR